MQEVIIAGLQSLYGLEPVIGNPYARIDRQGVHIAVTTYRVRGFGSLAVIDLKAMLGLIRMESVVLNAKTRDLPLYCGSFVKAAGRGTLLEEFYNTMTVPMNEEMKGFYRRVKAKYKDLPPYENDARRQDELRYDFSLAASGQGLKEKEAQITKDYFDAYLQNVAVAPACHPEEKRKRTAACADALLKQGGPVTDQFAKLIGAEAARELFETYVFCCR